MTAIGLDLISGILILTASVVPIFFMFKLTGILRIMMITLFIFTLVHGSYHVLVVLNYNSLAENVVEPISYVSLIIFGLIYLKSKIARGIEI